MKKFKKQELVGTLPGMLDFPGYVERLPNGNTLIVDLGYWSGDGSEVIEVNKLGQIVWQYGEGLKWAHCAVRLENGNTIISDLGHNRIIEVDMSKRIVWTSENWGGGSGKLSDGSHLNYPNSLKVLPNGHLLISDRNNDRVIEVDRGGHVIWSYNKLQHQHGAEKLANGNIIVANSEANRVEEISPDGNIVWSYGNDELLDWPRDADRLANGNTLITDSRNNRVIEVDREGNIVWSYATDYRSQPFDAERLPNGNTLISDQQHKQVFEVDSAGNVVWCFRNFYRTIPIFAQIHNPDFELEAFPKAGVPADWIKCTAQSEGGGKLTWDSNVYFKGKHSIAIENDRHSPVWWQQTIQVSEGKTYQLSGYVKTHNLDGFAQLQLGFLDGLGGYIHFLVPSLANFESLPAGPLHKGTIDWTFDRIEAQAPDKATAVNIRCFMFGRGKAWFDALSFTEMPGAERKPLIRKGKKVYSKEDERKIKERVSQLGYL